MISRFPTPVHRKERRGQIMKKVVKTAAILHGATGIDSSFLLDEA
jgi:hypothetical protein